MDLLLDPLNALDVSAVPIVLLVDERGTIRYRNPAPDGPNGVSSEGLFHGGCDLASGCGRAAMGGNRPADPVR